MIELRQISKQYGEEEVLKGIDLKVGTARSVILFGGSGSGKSTLLRTMAGLEPVDAGQILFNGKDMAGRKEREWNEIRRQMGIVFQEGALFDSLTVRDNVAYRLEDEGGWSEEEVDDMVRQVLGFVGLEHTFNMLPSELSGGMRRRVAIARAIIGKPRIMLYDEPTAGLDPITARTICDLIVKLRDMEGVTSVVVSHDLNAAFFISDYAMQVESNGMVTLEGEGDDICYVHTDFGVLKDGQILFFGNRDMLQLSTDPYIQEFIR